MKASELIGKMAIRTAPSKLGDHSYTRDAVLIKYATDTHILYVSNDWDGKLMTTEHIMDYTFCDDNWIDYEEFMKHSADAKKECSMCKGDIEMTGMFLVGNLMYLTNVNYCPECGRKLKENT